MLKTFTRIIAPGLFNAGWVKEGSILRMGWPTSPAGYDSLKELGIKTRINLRTMHSDESVCKRVGIRYLPLPIDELNPLSVNELRNAVDILTDQTVLPIVFGCAAGSDRTGLFALCYRVWEDKWTKDEALAEMYDYVNPQFRLPELWHGISERIEEL